jgi:hypothetical protein
VTKKSEGGKQMRALTKKRKTCFIVLDFSCIALVFFDAIQVSSSFWFWTSKEHTKDPNPGTYKN